MSVDVYEHSASRKTEFWYSYVEIFRVNALVAGHTAMQPVRIPRNYESYRCDLDGRTGRGERNKSDFVTHSYS